MFKTGDYITFKDDSKEWGIDSGWDVEKKYLVMERDDRLVIFKDNKEIPDGYHRKDFFFAFSNEFDLASIVEYEDVI